WLHRALLFVQKASEQQIPDEVAANHPLYDLSLSQSAVNEQVNAITVSAQAPHPGYGIRIASITFEGMTAVIHTEPVLPDPDMMYPQVITEVKATTYVDAQYEAVLAESSDTASESSVSASVPARKM